MGPPRLAKQFEVIGRRHGITTPNPRPWKNRSTDSNRSHGTAHPAVFEAVLPHVRPNDIRTIRRPGSRGPSRCHLITRSHKFIPVFIGAQAATALSAADSGATLMISGRSAGGERSTITPAHATCTSGHPVSPCSTSSKTWGSTPLPTSRSGGE